MSDTLGTKAYLTSKKNTVSIATNTTKINAMTNTDQIKGQVVLTQDEYNALPAGKLTDGKIYLIKE